MKYILKRLCAALACVGLICGCAKVEDTLPDSYYLTDNITETTTGTTKLTSPVDYETSATTAHAATEPPEESESRSQVEFVVETKPSAEQETEISAGTSESLSEIAPTETAPPETSAAVTTEFVPGTLPPRETQPAAPSVTVVTIPTAPAFSETAAVTAGETAVFTEATTAQTYPSYYPENSYYPLKFDRQKGMWVSYLEFDRIMRGASEEKFTQALNTCFDNIAALGCNTVYFQVRVYGDAYYKSELFPKGDRLTDNYDPLEIAVKSAHDRGLALHAWVNPMRLMTDSQMKNVSSAYQIGKWYNDPEKNGTYLVNSNGRWYLNPAYPETVSLICDGISEIVSRYKVDGVQIDDYFYPTTDKSFDSSAFAASGTSLSLADWRRENVTQMVRRMYSAVHAANSDAVFGISPQGNTKNNYNDLYADIYTWCSSSDCCDYICPQIYFGFENAALPYSSTVDEWVKLVTNPRVKLVIGLAAYKAGTEDKYAGAGSREWIDSTDVLARQRQVTDNYGIGYAYFRYDSLFVPEPSAAAYASAELENLKR